VGGVQAAAKLDHEDPGEGKLSVLEIRPDSFTELVNQKSNRHPHKRERAHG
jgi:hypothetical protein